ncbi:TldD/PmbA family protein [bacterium]|nr:TldD/PmbA family protein [candidate division CSSED10-310 bacterium]
MNHEKHQVMAAILEKARAVADEAEIFNLESDSMSIGFRNGILREMHEAQDSGCCLRIIKNHRIAHVTTSNMDRALDLVEQALLLVPFGETVSFSFPKPAVTAPDTTATPAENRLDQMVEDARGIIESLIAYEPAMMPNSGSDITSLKVSIMNSNGVDRHYETTVHSLSAVAILAEEGNILSTYRYHLGQDACPDPQQIARDVIELIRMGRNNVPFAGGHIPILMTPHAMADIFAAFGAGISGSAIAKGMSPLTGKLGHKLMNENISIVDDPLIPGATGTQVIDDEGVACSRKFLIENGVLKNYLLDLNSASKLNLEPTGNGFRYTPLIKNRSYAASPGPAFTNLLLPSGDQPYRDILSSAPRMLLIDQLTGVLLGNLINGDWSGNIEYGILFENGEPRGRIKNAMTGGNFYHMFNELYVESSSERNWVSGFGGGAGSSLFPYVLFDGLTVSA